jgi:hypothetical protein
MAYSTSSESECPNVETDVHLVKMSFYPVFWDRGEEQKAVTADLCFLKDWV